MTSNRDSLPPKWKSDTLVGHCDKCGAEFTLFRRRHHCRGCGNIFCDPCSLQRTTIAGSGDSPQRVCDECYIQAGDNAANGAARYVPFSALPRERKVCVLGSANTGKTAIVHHFVSKQFLEEYSPTISSTQRKVIRREKGDEYELVVVDSAGQSSCDMFKPSLCIGTHGYVIVYSITDRASFNEARAVHGKLSECHGDVPVLLVGNKSDLERTVERQVTHEEGVELAVALGCAFLECTATRHKNVLLVFSTLLDMLVDAEGRMDMGDRKGIVPL